MYSREHWNDQRVFGNKLLKKAVCFSLSLARSFNYWVFLDSQTRASSNGKKKFKVFFNFFFLSP